jgi:outer membrane receptor protein involved in Fe transport
MPRYATSRSSWRWSWCLPAAAIAWSLAPADVHARSPGGRIEVDVASDPLPDAIAELASEAHVSIGAEGALPRRRGHAVRGRMSVSEALARMLAGSGYAARRVGSTAWRIERVRQDTGRMPAQVRQIAPQAQLDRAPIIVTATKRPAALTTLSYPLSAVELGGAVQGLPQDGTGAVAEAIDGMTMTGMGAGRNKIFLRGVADSPFDGEGQGTVAVLVNDARVTYSAPDPDLRLVDVEQVDVLKGPQGSLYGTGVLGGIYQIRTNRPDLDAAGITLTASGQTGASSTFGGSGSVVANLPLTQGSSAVRLVAYGAREPGWIDTGSQPDSNGSSVIGGRASLAAETADGWRFDLMGLSQRLAVEDSQYVYQPYSRERPAQQPEPHDNDFDLLSLRVSHPVGSGELVLSSSHAWHEVRDVFDAKIGAEGFGIADPNLFVDDRHYRLWDSEAQLSGTEGWGDWLVGLSHLEARQEALSTLQSATPGVASTVDEDKRSGTDSALFGNLAVPLSSAFTAELGGRLFRSNVKDTRLVAGQQRTIEQQRIGLTPSAAMSWTPREGRTVYLRYGSAFRQGGVDIGTSGQAESYSSDELQTVEAGWREGLVPGGSLELSAYFTSWDDMQSDTLLPNGLIETRNAGKARILGFEASLVQPLARDWNLALGGTLEDAQLIRSDLGIKLEDTRLPVIPSFVLRGAIARSFTLGRASGSLRFKLRYVGPSRLSFDPALDRPMGRVLESGIEGRLALDGFDISLSVDNLLNRSADVFAFGNPFRFATMPQFTPQRPISATLAVRRAF